MKLGLSLGYFGVPLKMPPEISQGAEKLGFNSVWTVEVYGSATISSLSFLAVYTTFTFCRNLLAIEKYSDTEPLLHKEKNNDKNYSLKPHRFG